MAGSDRDVRSEQVRADLLREVAAIEKRLRDGEVKINSARAEKQLATVERWERAWITLLRRYEQLNDELASLESISRGPIVE